MPRIKISSGEVKYSTRPLYLGVKKINKEIATENLLKFKELLDAEGIIFGLIAGTLLGVIREKDFISHDEDIDLFFLEEQRCNLLDLLPRMKKLGFEVARYDRRGLLSIIRKGEYIDLYFFKELCPGIRHCCGWCIPEELLINTGCVEFKGVRFLAPLDWEGFLVYEYGYNWATPIKWVDFELPTWKRKINEWKDLIKENLPDILFYPIAYRKEKKMLRMYSRNMERYNQLRNKSLKIPV